jgi:hypothetical protein
LLSPSILVGVGLGGIVAVGGLAGGTVVFSVAWSGGEGSSAVGGSIEAVVALSPSLSIIFIIVAVVPFVVGLSFVLFGAGLVVRLINMKVLISSPSIEVFVLLLSLRFSVATGGGGLGDRGSLV